VNAAPWALFEHARVGLDNLLTFPEIVAHLSNGRPYMLNRP
jgi:hypothetical protein